MTSLLRNRNFLFGFFAALFLACINQAVATDQYYLIAIPFVAILFYAGWISLRSIFLLLLFTLPFSVQYRFTESLGAELPHELLMLLVAGLFLCNWAYKPWILSRQVWAHPLMVLLMVHICWVTVSTLFSTQPLLSLWFLLTRGWYICAFVLVPLIVFNEKATIHRAITVITLAMTTVTVVTLIRHSFYGFTFDTINDALDPFFRNHVNYSTMLLCMIPVVFVYAQTVKAASLKAIAVCILVILLAALILSCSRGAWLALPVGIIAAWLIRKKVLVHVYIAMIAVVTGSMFWIRHNDRYLQYAHDYRVMDEQRIPGLIFFLLLTAAMLYYAQHLYHRVQDVFYKRMAMLTGVVIMMILTVNFLSDMIWTGKIESLFFLSISLLVASDINTRTGLAEPKSSP